MTKTVNTATIDPSVLATSNGHKAMNGDKAHLGSTSKGSVSGANEVGPQFENNFMMGMALAMVVMVVTLRLS